MSYLKGVKKFTAEGNEIPQPHHLFNNRQKYFKRGDDESMGEDDSDLEIAARDMENESGEGEGVEGEEFENARRDKFGLVGINNVEQIKQRVKEVKANFYNRLESKRLIKKHGRIPFTEHMTVSKEKLKMRSLC